jgi:type II secretory pathway pseudopilin PulG
MTTDEPFTPPRNKPHVFWWLGGVFLLVAIVFLLQLFGPNPAIVVSPQTTFITKPLGADGLPDFEKYVHELYREGATSENNAAVPLLQALWPAELNPNDYAAIVMELGLEQIPSKDEALQGIHDQASVRRVAAWLGDRANSKPQDAAVAGEEPDYGGDDPFSSTAETVIERSQSRPWTSDQIPPLAEWVAANQKPLDLIVEGSKLPRYYSPSPTLINNKRDVLYSMLLPNVQAMRDAARAVAARAMWHLGEKRLDAAWQDIMALHRLARLVAQGHTLIEQLVAMAISGIACDATVTLLDSGQLTADQVRQVQRDLATLPPLANVARSLDQMERSAALDAFIYGATGGGNEMFTAISGVQDTDFGNNVFNVVSVDWNLVLRETNAWYDRLVAAANIADRAARATAMQKFDADIQQLVAQVRTPTSWLAGVVSRQQRSKLVASIMLGMFLPAVNAAVAAEDRSNASLELLRLAAALAVYRAEHGSYPERLDELVPGVLDSLPVDLFGGKPFAYKRDGAGYLLYSFGQNGGDDGGSNEQLRILKGRPIDELAEAAAQSPGTVMPSGADDMSIRVPRPAFELPNLPQPAGDL